jgi:hypothetical protein
MLPPSQWRMHKIKILVQPGLDAIRIKDGEQPAEVILLTFLVQAQYMTP